MNCLHRHLLCPTVLVLLLLCQLASRQRCAGQNIKPRIVGGQKTTQSAVGGYVVNLRYDGQFYCGGSLVTKYYVVTAGHCVYGYQPNRMTVQGGVSKLTETGVVRRVAKTTYSSKFDSQRLTMDVAVVKLREAMQGSNIATVPLCSVQWSAGDYMRVSGWGITRNGNTNPSIQLRTVQLRLISKAVCSRKYFLTDRLYGSTFCASSPGKDSCSGDSGGGVIYKNQLCGIVSWGLKCASPNYPGVYTSIHRVRSFIVKAMQN